MWELSLPRLVSSLSLSLPLPLCVFVPSRASSLSLSVSLSVSLSFCLSRLCYLFPGVLALCVCVSLGERAQGSPGLLLPPQGLLLSEPHFGKC